MKRWNFLAITLALALSHAALAHTERQLGESVIFIGEQPAALAHLPHHWPKIRVRSTYAPELIHDYVEGRDYTIDYAAGTLRRTAHSSIPDFQTNILFGQEDFDHTKFPGYGNAKFIVWVDYNYTRTEPWPKQDNQLVFLSKTQEKLRTAQSLKMVAFGDSITAGGEASKPPLIFWHRWANELQNEYPRAKVAAINGATGGDTTAMGLGRLQAKVIDEQPDLVLIGFGMNDNNKNSVSIPDFSHNLAQMIERIRAATKAEIILYSAFPPNPKWKFGSSRMAEYANATKMTAAENGCAYADIFDNWQAIAARKKPEDMLGNNINHPNDFGHWIYFRVFEELGLTPHHR